MMNKHKTVIFMPYLLVGQAIFLFAGSTVLAKRLSLSALMLIFIRGGISTLYFLVTKRQRTTYSKETTGILALLGIALLAHRGTFYVALNMTSVSIAEIGWSTGPIFMLFLEAAFYKQKITRTPILLAVGTLIGMAILFPGISMSETNTVGLLLAILSGFLYAIKVLFTRYATQLSDPSTAVFAQSVVVMALSFPFITTEFGTLPRNLIPRLLAFGVFGTAIPHVCIARSLLTLRPYVVTLLMNLVPFFAILLSSRLLKETITIPIIIGGTIILLCGIFASHYEYLHRPASHG